MDEYEELDVYLTANNSSGKQRLILCNQDDEMYFTLVGEYDGEDIQIDFDESTRSELIELRDMIDIMLET